MTAKKPLALALARYNILAHADAPRWVTDPIRVPAKDSEGDPPAVEEDACGEDRFSGNRPDGGALHKLGKAGHRRGVDDDLAEIGERLDRQDIPIGARQPASDRAGDGDVVLGFTVVLRKHLLPAVSQAQPCPKSMGA